MTSRRVLPWLGLIAVFLIVIVWASWPSGDRQTVNEQAHELASEIRCPDCEGLNVADSFTTSARAIRKDLLRRLKAGESESEIKSSYADRYGESILLNPDSSGLGILVWGLPIVVLIFGGAGIAFTILRRSKTPRLTPTDDDRSEVDRARDQ